MVPEGKKARTEKVEDNERRNSSDSEENFEVPTHVEEEEEDGQGDEEEESQSDDDEEEGKSWAVAG